MTEQKQTLSGALNRIADGLDQIANRDTSDAAMVRGLVDAEFGRVRAVTISETDERFATMKTALDKRLESRAARDETLSAQLEALQTSVDKVATQLETFKASMPETIDKHMKTRRKSVWSSIGSIAAFTFYKVLPAVYTIMLTGFLIWAVVNGIMSPQEAVMSAPIG